MGVSPCHNFWSNSQLVLTSWRRALFRFSIYPVILPPKIPAKWMCKVLKCKRQCIIIPNFTLYEDQRVFPLEWVFAPLLSSCHAVGPYVSSGNKIRLCVIWFYMPEIKIRCFRCPSKVALTKQELRIHCSTANYGSYVCDTRNNGKASHTSVRRYCRRSSTISQRRH